MEGLLQADDHAMAARPTRCARKQAVVCRHQDAHMTLQRGAAGCQGREQAQAIQARHAVVTQRHHGLRAQLQAQQRLQPVAGLGDVGIALLPERLTQQCAQFGVIVDHQDRSVLTCQCHGQPVLSAGEGAMGTATRVASGWPRVSGRVLRPSSLLHAT